MEKYEDEYFSTAEKWELKNEEQLDRLAKLLRQGIFQKIKSLPYRERYSLEKITEQEDLRIKGWRGALSSSPPSDVLEFSEILNASSPDVQGLASICAKHGLEAYMPLLAEIFHEGKKTGMAEVASKRGKQRTINASENHVKLGKRWLELEYEDPKKYSIKAKVVLQLSDEFPEWEPDTIRKLLGPKNYPALFPKGVKAAREAAGLPPWPRKKK